MPGKFYARDLRSPTEPRRLTYGEFFELMQRSAYFRGLVEGARNRVVISV